jgi:hypothetical protein
MPNPNQSNIPVSKSERQVLDLAKTHYEQEHGKCDWGDFLGGLAAGVLLGAGIVAAARAIANREQAWMVECPYCHREVRVLVRGKPPSAEVLNCPYDDCQREFVIQYRT